MEAGKRRLQRDKEEVEDRPVGDVGVIMGDDETWLLFVRPHGGSLKGSVLIYRLEFGSGFPSVFPVWSGLSYVPTEYFEKASSEWTATHSLRDLLRGLRDNLLELQSISAEEAARIVAETNEVFANQFRSAVFIPTMEVEALQNTVKQAKPSQDREAFLTASQLFSISESQMLANSVSMSVSGSYPPGGNGNGDDDDDDE